MKCPHCPLAGEARPCPGERNPRVCSNADPASPGHMPAILARILAFTGDAPPPPASPPEPSEADLLILACDYRERSADECGCTGREFCALGRGSDAGNRHAVSYADCLACVGAPAYPNG